MSLRPEFTKALGVLSLMRCPVVVEVGSHRGDGVHSMLLANPTAMVHAIEPDPFNYKVLVERMEWYNHIRANTVVPHNIAVIGIGRDLSFHSYRGKYSRNSVVGERGPLSIQAKAAVVKVKGVRLDELCRSEGIQPNFIRFDCYGSEYDVFCDFRKTFWGWNKTELKVPLCVKNAEMVLVAFHWKRDFCNGWFYDDYRKAVPRLMKAEGFRVWAKSKMRRYKHQHYLWVKESFLESVSATNEH